MGELKGRGFGIVEAKLLSANREEDMGRGFSSQSPSQAWFEEQAEKSAGGMLCKDHRESADTALILTPAPAPEKSVL